MKTKLLLLLLLITAHIEAQITLIPDSNFEQRLIDLGHDNVLDGQVLTANISNVVALNVTGQGINDLSGIEDFTALGSLHCNLNSLTALDVSSNINLTTLVAWGNNISSIDLSNNILLNFLSLGTELGGNDLTSVDLSNNTLITFLSLKFNDLTSLDVSNNILLETLLCDGNEFSTIDVSNNVNLTNLQCGYNTNLVNLDVTNNTALETLFFNNSSVNSIDVTNQPSLRLFRTHDSNISSLDLSNNPLLEQLRVYNCQLSSIDISNNTLLNMVWANNNLITSLDASNNTLLTNFRGFNNQLTELNMKNGNNSILTSFSVPGNPSLSCIQVDDEVAASSGTGSYGSWQVDAGVTFSENCSGCPEMDIQGNGISIGSGDETPSLLDDTDFGIIDFGTSTDRTFTIINTQNVDLTLTGTPLIEITNSTDFTVVTQPNSIVAANGGTTTFTIKYSPSSTGTINTANLSIANDDCDENPYTFDVVGQSQESLELNDSYKLGSLIKVVPNPNEGFFKINYEGVAPIEEVILYNVLGKLLKTIDAPLLDHTFNFNDHSGIFFLEIKTKTSRAIKKIIIK